MSPFTSTGLNRKIDNLMDRLFGAGVASHATIIEQINYLMFLRALAKHDDEAKLLNPSHEEIFKGDLAKYRWDNLLMLNAEVLFDTLEEAYRRLPELTTDKIISLLFRNAHIKIYDKPTLRVLLHEIEKLVTELDDVARHGEKDIFGDMYEYLLSKLAQAGTNGQFRTPRHIIKFIVDVVDPSKGETILDPACGTAGFLVSALDHLRHKYTSERFVKDGAYPMDKLTGNERDFIFNHAFTGFDSDEDMVKFGVMNLYLHNLSNAQIKRQNTLVDTAGDRTKWDVVLANPPFAGKIESESISEDLRMGTRATEVLFVRYMIDHLSSQGKAGIIVPEGVIFQSTNAHKQLRQKLVDAGLWCVVSLPSGVFQPYSGVKTSILIIDKELAKKFNRIMFITINSDGFELNANRRKTLGDDLPNAYRLIEYCKKEINAGNIRDSYYFPFKDEDHSISVAPLNYSFEKVSRVNEEPDLSLRPEHYQVKAIENHQIPLVKLGEVAEAFNGKTFRKNEYSDVGTLRTIKVKDYDEDSVYFDRNDNGWVDSEVSQEKLLQKGDTLIINAAHSASHVAGKIGYLSFEPPVKACTSGEVMIVRPKANISPRLLNYLIKSDNVRRQLKDKVKGIHLYPKDVLEVYTPLPPLSLQKEIVNDVTSYQKIVDGSKNIINNWKPSIQFSSDWEMIKLSKLIKELETGVSVNSENRPAAKDEFGVLKTSSVTYGVFQSKENKKILNEELNRARVNPKKDRIIISRMNTPLLVGASVFVDDDYPNLYLPDRLWQTVWEEGRFLPQFIFYVLSSPSYRKIISSLSGGTSGSMKNISKTAFLNLDIPLPPLDVQENICKELKKEADLAKASSNLAEIYQQKIEARINELWT